MGGDKLLSTRMYTGWRTLWPGLTKNLVDTLGGPATTLALALTAICVGVGGVMRCPDWILRSGGSGVGGGAGALVLALAGSGAAIGLHIAATFYFRIPFWYGLALSAWLYGGRAAWLSIACAAV